MDFGKLRRITRWEDLSDTGSQKWSRISHRILHMHSVTPFKTYKIQLATQWVSRRTWELVVKGCKDHWNDLMTGEGYGPFCSELGRRIEKHALNKLARGGEFTCCRLTTCGMTTSCGEDFKLPIPTSNRIPAKRVLVNHLVNQLYSPEDRNYAGIDA
jgi:hypothetical protein